MIVAARSPSPGIPAHVSEAIQYRSLDRAAAIAPSY
jgi:hypothetical protein